MGHCLWIHNLELAIRYFDDIDPTARAYTDAQHRHGAMILRDSRLTRHPSCLTNGIHLIFGMATALTGGGK